MATKKKNPAVAKERKYTSKEKHEQDYKSKRKSAVKSYKQSGGSIKGSNYFTGALSFLNW